MDMKANASAAPARLSGGESIKHLLDGMRIQFPTFKHDHPPVIDVNAASDEEMTLGQKVADKVATGMGSWRFIIIQASLMVVWVTINSIAWVFHFDGYPYILLNLAMSAQAAFATPLIMMSQNRQSEKDRLTAQNDYITDCKGEEEVRHIMEHLDHQDALILQIIQRLEAQHGEILHRLRQLDPEVAKQLEAELQQVTMEQEEQQ